MDRDVRKTLRENVFCMLHSRGRPLGPVSSAPDLAGGGVVVSVVRCSLECKLGGPSSVVYVESTPAAVYAVYCLYSQ